jgi:hypothetical protein
MSVLVWGLALRYEPGGVTWSDDRIGVTAPVCNHPRSSSPNLTIVNCGATMQCAPYDARDAQQRAPAGRRTLLRRKQGYHPRVEAHIGRGTLRLSGKFRLSAWVRKPGADSVWPCRCNRCGRWCPADPARGRWPGTTLSFTGLFALPPLRAGRTERCSGLSPDPLLSRGPSAPSCPEHDRSLLFSHRRARRGAARSECAGNSRQQCPSFPDTESEGCATDGRTGRTTLER